MCICDDCIKKDVCRLQEHCTKLEEHYKGLTVDEAFTVTVLCKYKQVAKPMIREPFIQPVFVPCKPPTVDPGRIWTTDRTPFDSPRVRW